MASSKSKAAAYKCAECGWQTSKWIGRCGECQAWGTVEEVGIKPTRTTASGYVSVAATPIAEIDISSAEVKPT